MTYLRGAILIGLVLAVSACTHAIDGAGAPGGVAPGAAGSAADPASPAYFQQAVGERVLFPVDEATLPDSAKPVLDGQAAWLRQNAGFTAVIEGHADEQGTREYNLALGARRATAVREYLVAQGVSGDRLQVVSFGKERPIEICSEESCYAQNRRAVTVLSGGLSG